jgi:uroporphyrin-III C-methyltransferase
VSSGLALIFSFAALLVTGYLWYTLIYERPELVKLDLPGALADIERTTGEIKGSVDDAEDQIAVLSETQSTLKSAVDKIQADLGSNQAQWIVSEAEQLLLIANRRLQLARDASSALAALRAADRQLELLASPSLLPVRREIAKEIALLESLERADIAGMSLKLGTLADNVDQLPLAPDLRAKAAQVAAADTRNDTDTASNLWRDLLSLVQIRRHDTAQRPLLPPEQQYFARENLRLMLYGAQHALLQGNVATFQQNLNTASRWIASYFDAGAAAVDAAQQDIEKLRATPVMQQLPEITGSLEMLRKAAARQRTP